MSGSDSNTRITEEFKASPNESGLKIVEVDWLDSYGVHGWGDRDQRATESHSKMGTNTSVGYVFVDTPDWLGLTESISHMHNIGCTVVIPRIAVLSIRIIRDGPTA